MNKAKILALKQRIVEISQEICNELEGAEVAIEINTVINTDMSGAKSTIVTGASVSINEEI